MKLLNRLRSRWTRYHKARDAWHWGQRWDRAIARSWAILWKGNPSVERFNRWEKNHRRLIRLIEEREKGGAK